MGYYLANRRPPLTLLSFQFHAGQWNAYVRPHVFVAFDPSFLKRYTYSHYINSYLVYLSGVLDHFLNPGLPIFLIFFDNRFQYFPTLSNRISDIFRSGESNLYHGNKVI